MSHMSQTGGGCTMDHIVVLSSSVHWQNNKIILLNETKIHTILPYFHSYQQEICNVLDVSKTF